MGIVLNDINYSQLYQKGCSFSVAVIGVQMTEPFLRKCCFSRSYIKHNALSTINT